MSKSFKIKVYGWDWTIQFVPKKSPQLYLDEEECYGICHIEKFIIYICNTEISKELMLSTIIHEVTHVMMTVSGLRKAGDRYSEEEICEFIQWHGQEILRLSKEIYKKGLKGDNKK